jgi:hypothetical protein
VIHSSHHATFVGIPEVKICDWQFVIVILGMRVIQFNCQSQITNLSPTPVAASLQNFTALDRLFTPYFRE